jgi:hypothetical protein
LLLMLQLLLLTNCGCCLCCCTACVLVDKVIGQLLLCAAKHCWNS